MATKHAKLTERLKDREDLRRMLIEKKENLEARIKGVEDEIGKIRKERG